MEKNNQLIEAVPPKNITPALCQHIIDDIPRVIAEETTYHLLEKEGKEIYDTNKTMQDFAWFMEDPVTREIYDKYFNNWGDITGTMLFLRLYAKMDAYLDKKKIVLNGYHKIALVNKIMKNESMRQAICKDTAVWINRAALTTEPATPKMLPPSDHP